MKNSLQTAFKTWIGLTVLVIVSLAVIYFRNGITGLSLFIQQWPLSNLVVTLSATTLTWLLLGMLLHLLVNEKINTSNVITIAGFFLVMFIYLNILRERFRYGDYAYYIEAATALLNNQTLPDTYLYLPLWATVLQFIVPFGDQGVLTILWTVNMAALGAFYFLLHRVLERYGFPVRFAAIIAVFFILINAPIQRTLGFVQVNLLVMDLVLLSVLYYPRNILLSALMLALAVHLKTSPAVLVLVFLLERDWRWLAWFALSFLIIAVIPVAINGISPYYDYLHNIVILTQIPDTNFHDTSFDSFLRFLNPFFGINILWTRIMIYIAKAALALSTIIVMARTVRNQTFISGDARGSVVLNAIPALFVLMTLASPIVWDHHGVFVTLSFLLMIKRIESPSMWMWFGFAYFLEFILPSFDFFPWSYGRLVAPMIVLYLMSRTTKNNEPTSFTTTMNQLFAKLAS